MSEDFFWSSTDFGQENGLILDGKILFWSSLFSNFLNFLAPLSQILRTLLAVGWVNLEIKDWIFCVVYSSQYSCSLNFVIVNRDDQIYQNYFKSTFVLYNLIVSAAIFICYILVTIKIYEKDSFCFNRCKIFRNNNASFQAENSARNVENRQMFKRISLTVVTNLMCWVPLCIVSITIWNVPFGEFFALFGSTPDYLTNIINRHHFANRCCPEQRTESLHILMASVEKIV